MGYDRSIPKPGEFYQHFKGHVYQIVTIAIYTETNERMVIYQALYGEFKVYARPLSLFMSEVDRMKYPKVTERYRFRQIRIEDYFPEESVKQLEMEKEPLPKEEPQPVKTEPDVPKETAGRQGHVQSALLDFLDAQTHGERLDVLHYYQDTVSESVIDSMALSLDFMLSKDDRESKYYELEKFLKTKAKYEKARK